MTKSTTNETTITVVLTPQEIEKITRDLNLIPKDWTFFSIDVKGNGISNGATLTLKYTHTSAN